MSLRTILVVEDSPTERQLMLRALEGLGGRVLTADNGDDALEVVQNERPDLVLLDVVMPGTNGFQVCRRIKHSPLGQSVRVILVTSKKQESDRYWGLRQGADDFLTKPFEAETLRAAVERQIGTL